MTEFTCPCCRKTSDLPEDAEEKYCGLCHWWTGNPELGPVHLEMPCPVREITGFPPDIRPGMPDLRLRLAYTAFMVADIGVTVAASWRQFPWIAVIALSLGAIATIYMARRVRGGLQG